MRATSSWSPSCPKATQFHSSTSLAFSSLAASASPSSPPPPTAPSSTNPSPIPQQPPPPWSTSLSLKTLSPESPLASKAPTSSLPSTSSFPSPSPPSTCNPTSSGPSRRFHVSASWSPTPSSGGPSSPPPSSASPDSSSTVSLTSPWRWAKSSPRTGSWRGPRTANPANCYYQQDYPDFLFRVTNSDHLTELKDKFKRICEKSMVKKRYLHITEEILKANPNICRYKAPSLDPRQDMLILEVPKLGKEAALKAIEEWGQPISNITHLIFCTSSCVDMPGADFQLVKLLGLDPSVNRFMIYVQGCFAGGTALRLAKDVAENNPGARVLVVCCEITNMYFQAPTESHVDVLVGQALFSDGAAASIVGANPDPKINERQVYEIMSTRETIVPYSEHGVVVHFREMGCEYYLSPDVPKFIGANIEEIFVKGFSEIDGINNDWNSLFYSIHPGGPAILDKVEEKLGLNEGKLRATRHVLREYGNMGSPSVLFVLDEMRKKSMEEGKATTGEGLEWGVLIGIGPGLTVETVVLRSARIAAC